MEKFTLWEEGGQAQEKDPRKQMRGREDEKISDLKPNVVIGYLYGDEDHH